MVSAVSTETTVPSVSLEISGNYLRIAPAAVALSLLRDLLTYEKKDFGIEYGDIKVSRQWTRLYSISNDSKYLFAAAGFLDAITDLLKRSKVLFTVKDVSPVPDPVPDFSNIDELRPGQEPIFRALIENRRLIVQSPCASGKTFLSCQLVQAFPNSKLLFVVPGRDAAKSLRDRLLKYRGSVGLVGADSFTVGSVTVTTLASLPKLIDGYVWNLVVFDEVQNAGCDTAFNALMRLKNVSKMIGLSASPVGRGDGTDARVKALFGEIKFKLGYKEAVDLGLVTPVKYVFYSVDGAGVCDSKKWLVQRRNNIWRNPVRNRFIANVCRSWEDFGQILIFVKTVEHLLHLAKFLPDYSLCYSNFPTKRSAEFKRKQLIGDDFVPITNSSRDQLRIDFEKNKIQKCIATFVWGAAVDFLYVRTICRADAEVGAIVDTQLPGRGARVIDAKPFAVIVDFHDSFDSVLYKRSKRREFNYKSIGFTPLPLSEDRYVQSQPPRAPGVGAP